MGGGGGVTAGPLRKNNFFLSLKKKISEKRMTTKLEGGRGIVSGSLFTGSGVHLFSLLSSSQLFLSSQYFDRPRPRFDVIS